MQYRLKQIKKTKNKKQKTKKQKIEEQYGTSNVCTRPGVAC